MSQFTLTNRATGRLTGRLGVASFNMTNCLRILVGKLIPGAS